MKLTNEQKRKLIYELLCPICEKKSEFYMNEYNPFEFSFTFNRFCKICKNWFNIKFTFKTKLKYQDYLNTSFNDILKSNSMG